MSRIYTPHSYQYDIIDFIVRNKRCAIWAQMGSGKTSATLTALEVLSLEEDVYPALVLAPLRVARITWPDEISRWRHLSHLRTSVIAGGTPLKRQRAVAKEADLYFANYDQITWLVDHLKEQGREWPFKTIIADEFTRLKSFRLRQGSRRAKALGAVAHEYCDRFIGLTGTPSPNGLKDLWGQTWFLDKGKRLGKTFSAFEQRWFRKGWDGFSISPLPHAPKEIEDRLRDICLTVTGLPVDEPIFNNVLVDIPAIPRQLYDEMEKLMFIEVGANMIDAANAAVKTSKLLQLSNGAIYTDDRGGWEDLHNAKLDALDSILEEAAGTPVLVAYNFKSDLARLQDRYPKARTLDADPDTVRDWNAGRVPILFAHPASAGHGLNLAEGGNILVFFSMDWNLENYLQIIERIGPMRQAQAGLKRPVFVHHILSRDSIDLVVLERLQSKRSVQEVLLDALRRREEG